jgi:polyribonucleotide nucleotidyltransferase
MQPLSDELGRSVVSVRMINPSWVDGSCVTVGFQFVTNIARSIDSSSTGVVRGEYLAETMADVNVKRPRNLRF